MIGDLMNPGREQFLFSEQSRWICGQLDGILLQE
jgi:hypothetical protein